MGHDNKTGGEQGSRGRRDRLIDQLSYLIDEIAVLGEMLDTLPEGILTVRPYEGELSVVDLFAMLAEREIAVRIPNVEAFITASTIARLERPPAPNPVAEPSAGHVSQALDDLSAARGRLVDLVRNCDESVWERRALIGDEEVALEEYLFEVIQEDVDVLRTAARRVYESRPVGSPGFTAR